MRKVLLVLVVLFPFVTFAHHDDEMSVSIQTEGDEVQSCSDISVKFDDEVGLRAEEKTEIPARGTLHVELEQHGGAHVFGSAGSNYTVLLCKAVAPSRGQDSLRNVRLSMEGDTLTVSGPKGRDWVGYLIIGAPRGASLEINALNSPIGLDDVSGTFDATAVNGPISVKGSDGTITAKTTNGPISFAGGRGDITLSAVNGPLSVKLAGTTWQGRGLSASTANGPVSLALDPDYRSAVEISGGRGPWNCKGTICGEVARVDDDLKTMTLGAGAPLVRLSTTNGPVSIKSR